MSSHNLYEMLAADIDYDAVRQFILGAEAANLLTESLTLELKEKPATVTLLTPWWP